MARHTRFLCTSTVAATLIATLAGFISAAPPSHAARPVTPPTSQVGSLAAPATGWLTRVTACTHYVAPSTGGGADANPGTAARPWATLRKAMTALRPGQTGCVLPGTYAESRLVPAASGTDTAPIALRAQGSVIIAAPDDARTFEFAVAGGTFGYWLIEGFTIDKQGRDGTAVQLLAAAPGRLQAVAVRANVIRNGRAAAAVLVRGRTTDVVIEGNEIHGFRRWANSTGTTTSFQPTAGLGRTDANAISIEAIANVPADQRQQPSVQRVLIRRNSLHDNGGDGVQCQGGETVVHEPLPYDPADIDIVDNRAVNTAGSPAVEENAYDIKSCQRVSIRGTDPPGTSAPAAQYNKIGELLPTVAAGDLGGNNSDGTAIVLHYQARSILVENLRMWDVCRGFSIGNSAATVRNVLIRRTLVFGLRYGQHPPGGSSADAERCRSRAVTISNATGVDIVHSTFDGFAGYGVELSPGTGQTVADVDVWNSILVAGPDPSRAQLWMSLAAGVAPATVGSDYNLFWHPDGNPDGRHLVLDGDSVTLAEWRAAGFDPDRPAPLGSERGDPEFPANPRRNDYYTAAGSPARDGALANVGAPFCGTRPDIGFLETCT